MAGEGRTNTRAIELLAELKEAPGRFDFFTALRRLECAFRKNPRIGEARHPADEPVRFGQAPSMAFAPTVLAALEADKDGRPRLIQRALGLFGPNGPLPHHFTDYARDRLRNAGDATLVSFVDMFHHRMLELFYRAFASAEPTYSYDRPEEDQFGRYVRSLIGVGLPGFEDRDALPDSVRLFYAGRMAAQPKNADGLSAMVSDLFGVDVRIEQFIGEWVSIPEPSRWKLSTSGLGLGTPLGKRAWICQGKFRLVLGPMTQAQHESLLPGTRRFERLQALIRSYVGDQLAWDVQMIVDKRSRQPWCLGKRSRLGWTTSLGRRQDEDGRVVVKPMEMTNGRD